MIDQEIKRETDCCGGFKNCENREYDKIKEDCKVCFEDAMKAIEKGGLGKREKTMTKLDQTIEKSKQLLELKEDWDDEGAQPILPATLEMAHSFLYQCEAISICIGKPLSIPMISQCHNGSIDIHWSSKKDQFRVLVNIKEDATASMYGDNGSDKLSMTSTFDPKEPKNSVLYFIAELCMR